MTTVKVSEFISKSAAYMAKSIAQANGDKNPYLTKTEARRLPTDLKDNFTAHRFGAQDNSVVSVKKFQKNYVAYLAVNVKAADKNGNGILSKAEAKYLPTDLKDNFKNFRKFQTDAFTIR